MTGESKLLTVKIGAVDEAVAAGQKPCVTIHLSVMAGEQKVPCLGAKRKADEAAAGEECAAKRKVRDAPEKKMTRLPREEVSRILTRVADDRAPHYFESLKRKNPSLLPSPEEAADASTSLLYRAARAFYASRERIARFRTFVRGEVEQRGYVEVDEEFLARRAQVRAWSDAAKARALKGLAVSDED